MIRYNKAIFLILMLAISFSLYAQKQSTKPPSLVDVFEYYYPESSLSQEDDGGLAIITDEQFDQYDLAYSIGFSFAVLEEYYLMNNFDFRKFSFPYIVFYYTNIRNQWYMLRFTREEVLVLLNASIRRRSEIIQDKL